MERCVLCGHPDDGVGAALPRWPVHLPNVDARGVAVLAPDAVGGLGDRVPILSNVKLVFIDIIKMY